MKTKLITTLFLIACVLPCMAQHLSKKTEDYVSSRVALIYNSIFQNLNQIDSEIENPILQDGNDIEEMYCSASWNSLRSRVEKKESEEEDLFFDYDYWIDAQDYCDLHLINVKVESLCYDRSVVSVVISNCGNLTKKYLELCYEHDDWFVNDFITSFRGNMKDYLEGKAYFYKNE